MTATRAVPQATSANFQTAVILSGAKDLLLPYRADALSETSPPQDHPVWDCFSQSRQSFWSGATLDLLFSGDCTAYVAERLGMHQTVNPIGTGESWNGAAAVFSNSPNQVFVTPM
jgi:hypothetical protein